MMKEKEGSYKFMSTRIINFLGWISFTLSASAYLIGSWDNYWFSIGSFFFLIVCIEFLIPFILGKDSLNYFKFFFKKNKKSYFKHNLI